MIALIKRPAYLFDRLALIVVAAYVVALSVQSAQNVGLV